MCKFGLILFLMMFSISGKAQTRYTMSMTATAPTDRTMDVTLSITANSAGGERFGGYQAGINFSTAIINGGTISAAYVAGSKSSPALDVMITPTPGVATAGHVRLSLQAIAGSSAVDMVQGTTLILGTYRITNTVAWATGSNASLWLQNVTFSGKTNTSVNGYPFGSSTGAVSISTTAPVAGALALGYTQASPLSLTLNQPSETCFTSGVASNIVGTSCFGQTSGSATITMSPAASSNDITYTVDGGASTPGTLVSNAFNVSGLTAGSHTVVVTGAGGCTTPVVVNFNVGGPTTELSASSSAGTIACNGGTTSVTVSGTGGTAPYTGTGTFTVSAGPYSFTVTDANGCTSTTSGTVTEPAQLTNTTNQVACGSYTWSVTGLSYSTTGVYTGTTTNGSGCTINETLNLTILNNLTPSVGLTSSDLDNTFAYGTTVTFTASADNLGAGTASYDFKVNGTSVQNGASNVYVVNNLVNGNQVSVSITVTGGACLSSNTANSNVIANTVTGAFFTSITNYCGQTLPVIGSRIKCSVPSGVVGTLTYRFRVTNNVTSAVSIVNSNVASFDMTMVSGFSYGTSYNIEAAAVVNNIVQPYSSVCVISTPAVPVNQPTSTCGQTLAALNTRIFASAVSGAQLYRWRVALSTAPTTYFIHTTTSSSFRLTNVAGLNVTFDKTYLVAVQSDVVVNGVTTTSAYSSTPCAINTPSVASVSVSANQCGQTLASLTSGIFVNSVANAVSYTYRVRKVGTTTDYDYTSNFTSFKLSDVQGLSLTYDSSYEVSVSVKLLIDGVNYDSPFSAPCSISTPSSPLRIVQPEFSAIAYPNPFADNFLIDLTTESQSSVSIKVYDMVGRLVDSRESKASNLDSLAIGDQYPSGVYNVVVTQDEIVKTIRVVKR
ncbi:T9SS type A sorting domain-containing protein [Flavobacterium buctense]|uniref:T9SS type A sorting domain-containing protein n=2 Tax=Flavobacterium buctense TaxID=1648146 RepID=A0ABU9E5D4_9FLAO